MDGAECEKMVEIADKKADILWTWGTSYWLAWVVQLGDKWGPFKHYVRSRQYFV